MNCREFRKYVGAFADGELDTSTNATALEHLQMCPRCASKVNDIHELKTALRRCYVTEVTVPVGLPARIRQRIKSEEAVSRSRLRWLSRHIVPLGMAAAVLLVASLWRFLPSGDGPSRAIPAASLRLVNDIEVQHRMCLQRGAGHHNPSLGASPGEIRTRMSRALTLPVMVPELSDAGLTFHSADLCGLAKRPAGHVLYQCAQDSPGIVSLFSVARLDDLRISGEPAHRRGNHRYFVYGDAAPGAGALRVVAWHDDGMTYILCGDQRVDHLLNYAEAVRASVG